MNMGLNVFDNPVLCGPDAPADTANIFRVRRRALCAGLATRLRSVIAETERQAEHARDLIEVEYEDLPAVFDPARQ